VRNLAKLTNKQSTELFTIHNYLKQAIEFIKSDKTFVCRKSDGGTTIEYKNGDKFLRPMNKDIGSKLQYFEHALSGIERFIEKYEK